MVKRILFKQGIGSLNPALHSLFCLDNTFGLWPPLSYVLRFVTVGFAITSLVLIFSSSDFKMVSLWKDNLHEVPISPLVNLRLIDGRPCQGDKFVQRENACGKLYNKN